MHADNRSHTSPADAPPTAHSTAPAGPGVSETFSNVAGKLRERGLLGSRVLGLIVLVAVGLFAWRYISGQRAAATSLRWATLEGASSLEALDEIAKGDPSSTTAKIAELHEARYRLGGPAGIEGFQSNDPAQRKKAVENVEAARAAFVRLADVFKNDLTLKAQCLWGAAKAEETLVGIKKDGKGDPLGSTAKAIEYYEQLAAVAGATPMGDEARKNVALLKQKATTDALTEIQTALNGRLSAKSSGGDFPFDPGFGPGPKLGPLPGLPGGFEPASKPPVPPTLPAAKADTPAAVVTPPAPPAPAKTEPEATPKGPQPPVAPEPKAVTPPAPPATGPTTPPPPAKP